MRSLARNTRAIVALNKNALVCAQANRLSSLQLSLAPENRLFGTSLRVGELPRWVLTSSRSFPSRLRHRSSLQ